MSKREREADKEWALNEIKKWDVRSVQDIIDYRKTYVAENDGRAGGRSPKPVEKDDAEVTHLPFNKEQKMTREIGVAKVKGGFALSLDGQEIGVFRRKCTALKFSILPSTTQTDLLNYEQAIVLPDNTVIFKQFSNMNTVEVCQLIDKEGNIRTTTQQRLWLEEQYAKAKARRALSKTLNETR